jgi:hypothetical protein
MLHTLQKIYEGVGEVGILGNQQSLFSAGDLLVYLLEKASYFSYKKRAAGLGPASLT